MKHVEFMKARWLGAHRKSLFTSLFLVIGLVMASLTASASGNGAVVHDATNDKDEVFMSVEKMPVFPGGEAALMAYIRNTIDYPPEAADRNIQGKVIVQFVVDTTGQVGNVIVVSSVDKYLDLEAVRVVKTLPKFTPGTQFGKPVNVWYTLPVNFKLNDDIAHLLSFIHDVDSIRIDYCDVKINTPMAITPAAFDGGQFSQSRNTVLIKRKWQIRSIVNAMGGLAKLSKGQLDTRGKITLFLKDGKKQVTHFDQNSLYYHGNYYDISTFTAAGAEFRKILFPLINQVE